MVHGSRKKKPKKGLIPVAEYASRVGLSKSYVYRLSRLGAIEIKDGGLIDPEAADAALDRGNPSGGGESLYDAKRRKESALACLRELELKVKQGEYVHVETAERVWSETISRCRSRLLAIPTRATPLLEGRGKPEIFQILTDLIHEALTELSTMDAEEIGKEVAKEIPE